MTAFSAATNGVPVRLIPQFVAQSDLRAQLAQSFPHLVDLRPQFDQLDHVGPPGSGAVGRLAHDLFRPLDIGREQLSDRPAVAQHGQVAFQLVDPMLQPDLDAVLGRDTHRRGEPERLDLDVFDAPQQFLADEQPRALVRQILVQTIEQAPENRGLSAMMARNPANTMPIRTISFGAEASSAAGLDATAESGGSRFRDVARGSDVFVLENGSSRVQAG
ncbi:MAG: hypothetical protein MZV65_39875 [Chromatiales bacterium]|nr:hypothetical protein [Chromatiales bacterium]